MAITNSTGDQSRASSQLADFLEANKVLLLKE